MDHGGASKGLKPLDTHLRAALRLSGDSAPSLIINFSRWIAQNFPNEFHSADAINVYVKEALAPQIRQAVFSSQQQMAHHDNGYQYQQQHQQNFRQQQQQQQQQQFHPNQRQAHAQDQDSQHFGKRQIPSVNNVSQIPFEHIEFEPGKPTINDAIPVFQRPSTAVNTVHARAQRDKDHVAGLMSPDRKKTNSIFSGGDGAVSFAGENGGAEEVDNGADDDFTQAGMTRKMHIQPAQDSKMNRLMQHDYIQDVTAAEDANAMRAAKGRGACAPPHQLPVGEGLYNAEIDGVAPRRLRTAAPHKQEEVRNIFAEENKFQQQQQQARVAWEAPRSQQQQQQQTPTGKMTNNIFTFSNNSNPNDDVGRPVSRGGKNRGLMSSRHAGDSMKSLLQGAPEEDFRQMRVSDDNFLRARAQHERTMYLK